jgi:hypothetical protein
MTVTDLIADSLLPRCFRCGDVLPDTSGDLVCKDCEDSIQLWAELRDVERVVREIRRHFLPEQVATIGERLLGGR